VIGGDSASPFIKDIVSHFITPVGSAPFHNAPRPYTPHAFRLPEIHRSLSTPRNTTLTGLTGAAPLLSACISTKMCARGENRGSDRVTIVTHSLREKNAITKNITFQDPLHASQ